MNDTPAVATAIIDGIIGQADLITSLSLVVMSGLLALMIQWKFHNAAHPDPKKTFALNAFYFYVTALLLAGAAIILGFIIAGMMIEMTPILFVHEFTTEKFSKQDIKCAPLKALRCMAIAQVVAFMLAIGCAAMVIFKNKP